MLEMEEGEAGERLERLLRIRRQIGEALGLPDHLIQPKEREA